MTICKLFSFVAAVALTFPCLAGAQNPKIVDETLRQLEKDISAVRGLAFKTPVNAKVIPRGKEAKGVQGYYSTKDKTLYLYDDITGAYERGVLIHEMVHALQDQHFGLAKLHQEAFGSDAELAMAALIEGDATYTMIELLKKDQPKVEAMLNTSLEKTKNLRNAFLYGIGARYVKGLKDKGGWASVNARYRFFPPRTTASILNPGLGSIDLGPGKAVGAYAMIETLGASADARPLVLSAVNGLLADRIVEDGKVKAWQLAFDTKDHALRFREAYTAEKFGKEPKIQMLASSPGHHRWKSAEGRHFAVTINGTRVSVIDAATDAEVRASLDRLETPTLTIHASKDKRKLTFGELTDRLLEADIICVGESHDNELCHRVQLQIVKAIHASDPRLGVGMEMFQRPYQQWLDKYVQGEIFEDRMLVETEYRTRWGFHWSLYQPIAEFCRRNNLPLAALNLPRELQAKISKAGIKGLSDEDRKALGHVDLQVKSHRDYWYERLPKVHSGMGKVSEEQKERGYEIMACWDAYMGASAGMFQQARHLRRMVVIAGSGHIDRGFGIPDRAATVTGGKAVTIHIAPGGDAAKLLGDPPADYVITVR